MKREFVMLAHTYVGHEPIGGWYWSEKLDGMRCFYDGGITRGQLVSDVSFANTAKDSRYVTAPRATGLWSRYGKPIQAPDWWLDEMPPYPLDGELYIGRGGFQQLISTVKTLLPGAGWHDVRYMAFDSPPLRAVFANGEIDNVNFKKTFVGVIEKLGAITAGSRPTRWDFHSVYNWLRERQDDNDVYQVHEQHQLPSSTRGAADQVLEILTALTRSGAEGLMLRSPVSFWAPCRAKTLLKVKSVQDAEAEVVGYVWGRETDKGSKLLGKMGALVVKDWTGKRFELSGFTDDERTMCFYEGVDHGYHRVAAEGHANPGKPVSGTIHNPMFPMGSRVSYRYRELTDAGLPKEARYWRRHESE